MADWHYGSKNHHWRAVCGFDSSWDGYGQTFRLEVGAQAEDGYSYDIYGGASWEIWFNGVLIGSGSTPYSVGANGYQKLGYAEVHYNRQQWDQTFQWSVKVSWSSAAFGGGSSTCSGSCFEAALDHHTVSYNGNGGSTPASQTKWYGTILTLAGTPSRTGYGFDGWKGSDGTTYAAGGQYTKDADCTMTAQWHPLVTIPGTPTVTATRSSDTSISVVWTLTQPTQGSITSNRIEVKIDEEVWTTISSSLSGSATSYTYSSSSANHRYQFRVASSSSAGQSDYGESEYVYTTPAAPRGGYGLIRGTNVGVTALIDNIKYPSGYEWQRYANGSTGWTNINGAQSSISDTYSGSIAPYYRVRCVGVGGLASAYCPAFQVSKGYNIYVNSAGPTPDKINFYVPPGSSIKSIKILV